MTGTVFVPAEIIARRGREPERYQYMEYMHDTIFVSCTAQRKFEAYFGILTLLLCQQYVQGEHHLCTRRPAPERARRGRYARRARGVLRLVRGTYLQRCNSVLNNIWLIKSGLGKCIHWVQSARHRVARAHTPRGGSRARRSGFSAVLRAATGCYELRCYGRLRATANFERY